MDTMDPKEPEKAAQELFGHLRKLDLWLLQEKGLPPDESDVNVWLEETAGAMELIKKIRHWVKNYDKNIGTTAFYRGGYGIAIQGIRFYSHELTSAAQAAVQSHGSRKATFELFSDELDDLDKKLQGRVAAFKSFLESIPGGALFALRWLLRHRILSDPFRRGGVDDPWGEVGTSTLRRACDISRVAIKVLHGRASGLQVECTWLDWFFPACSTSSDGFDKHLRLFLSLERRAAEAVASRLETETLDRKDVQDLLAEVRSLKESLVAGRHAEAREEVQKALKQAAEEMEAVKKQAIEEVQMARRQAAEELATAQKHASEESEKAKLQAAEEVKQAQRQAREDVEKARRQLIQAAEGIRPASRGGLSPMELMELEGEESVEREQLQEPPGGPEPTELEEPTEETENELKEAEDEASDDGSDESWEKVKNLADCFALDTIFKTPDGGFVSGQHVRTGTRIRATDGSILQVSRCSKPYDAVGTILFASDATLRVTPDHRVALATGDPVPAYKLNVGDMILVNGEPARLNRVEPDPTPDPCVTITFDHDLPVDAFHPPPAIASHGHKRQQTRRGGMNRRAQASDAASVLTRNEYMD
ncbi:unnamed protein product [Durusdinium trenchii]|uniref:Hint domain-containing protein n=2 Tax=Durusdinium trenchii TaxID=1381693 RepID=A0ABP0HMN9_9DINO